MSKSFSKFISLIFNPLLMPIYMALIIVYVHPHYFEDMHATTTEGVFNPDIRLLIYTALMLGFPLFAIFLMRKLDLISAYNPADKKERFVPLIAIGTFWLWTYIMFKENTAYATASFAPLGLMTLGCIISLFIIFPINFTTSFSWHLIGVGALLSMLLNIIATSQYNLTFIFILAVILSGLIASAQLTLNNYSKNDLLTGFLIGFFGQFVAFKIWPFITAGF